MDVGNDSNCDGLVYSKSDIHALYMSLFFSSGQSHQEVYRYWPWTSQYLAQNINHRKTVRDARPPMSPQTPRNECEDYKHVLLINAKFKSGRMRRSDNRTKDESLSSQVCHRRNQTSFGYLCTEYSSIVMKDLYLLVHSDPTTGV